MAQELSSTEQTFNKPQPNLMQNKPDLQLKLHLTSIMIIMAQEIPLWY